MIVSKFMQYHYWVLSTSSYTQLLELDERIRRDRRISRCALRTYKYSSFQYLFSSGNNQALLNATGHDHRTFDLLLQKFRFTYDTHYVQEHTNIIARKTKIGRPRHLNATGALGLVLMWYRTRGSCARSLAMLFGLTSSPMYVWLKFTRKVLLQVLSSDEDSKVILPSLEKVQFFREVIALKYPLMGEVWGAVDGLKLLIQKAVSDRKQNQLYNGWTHGHYINCVFVFAPTVKYPCVYLMHRGHFMTAPWLIMAFTKE